MIGQRATWRTVSGPNPNIVNLATYTDREVMNVSLPNILSSDIIYSQGVRGQVAYAYLERDNFGATDAYILAVQGRVSQDAPFKNLFGALRDENTSATSDNGWTWNGGDIESNAGGGTKDGLWSIGFPLMPQTQFIVSTFTDAAPTTMEFALWIVR